MKPVVLCILDGWGLREDPFANAPLLADTPTYDRLMATCPHAQLPAPGSLYAAAGLSIGAARHGPAGAAQISASSKMRRTLPPHAVL